MTFSECFKASEWDWHEIEKVSLTISPRFAKMGWWNNKYYKVNPPNDGAVMQVDEDGRREIPYERNFFWPTTGRFGLGEKAVAYFSNDFAINCCETIEQYRQRDMTWQELRDYLKGDDAPNSDLYGYPLSIRIQSTAKIFDLFNDSFPFFDTLTKQFALLNKMQLLSDVILSKDKSVYPITQEIALAVHARGFDGLSYRSVRAPSDVSLPSRNLVLFNSSIIIRNAW
jgi:hypothetical protein